MSRRATVAELSASEERATNIWCGGKRRGCSTAEPKTLPPRIDRHRPRYSRSSIPNQSPVSISGQKANHDNCLRELPVSNRDGPGSLLIEDWLHDPNALNVPGQLKRYEPLLICNDFHHDLSRYSTVFRRPLRTAKALSSLSTFAIRQTKNDLD